MLKSRFRRRLEILEEKLGVRNDPWSIRFMYELSEKFLPIINGREKTRSNDPPHFIRGQGQLSLKALEESMASLGPNELPFIVHIVDPTAEDEVAEEKAAPAAPEPEDEEARLAAEVRALELRRAELKAKGKRA